MSLPSENQTKSKPKIVYIINSRLRYNYFRFGKANVRHIGQLFQVSFSTTSPNRRVILHQAAKFCPNRTTHCGNMMSYRFSRWRPSAMLYLLCGNGGPPARCFSWWSSNRLFVGLIVPEILRCIDFSVMAWNCMFTPLSGEFWGRIYPTWRHPSPRPPKGLSLDGNTSFVPFSVRIGATVSPGRVDEKNTG